MENGQSILCATDAKSSLEQLCNVLQKALSTKDEEETFCQLERLLDAVELLDEHLLRAVLSKIVHLHNHPGVALQKFLLEFLRRACLRDFKLFQVAAPCVEQVLGAHFNTLKVDLCRVVTELYPVYLQCAPLPDLQDACRSFEIVRECLVHSMGSGTNPDDAVVVRLVGECFLNNRLALFLTDEAHLAIRTKLIEDNRCLLNDLHALLRQPLVNGILLSTALDYLARAALADPSCKDRLVVALQRLLRNLPVKFGKSQNRSVQKLLRLLMESIGCAPQSSRLGKRAQSGGELEGSEGASSSSSSSSTLRNRSRGKGESFLSNDDRDSRKRSRRAQSIKEPLAPVDEWTPMAEYVYSKLSESCLVDLVVMSISNWPDKYSASLMSAYRPSSALPWNEVNKRKICTQLARSFTSLTSDEDCSSLKIVKQTIKPSTSEPARVVRKSHKVKPSNVPSSEEELNNAINQTFRLFLNMDQGAVAARGIDQIRDGFLITFPIKEELLQYIWNNPSTSCDVATLWIYRSYCIEKGFVVEETLPGTPCRYEDCICELLAGLMSDKDGKILLFCKLLKSAPLITSRVVDLMRKACFNAALQVHSLNLFKELIILRPRSRRQLFSVLISFATLSSGTLCKRSMALIEELFCTAVTRSLVRSAVQEFLNYLKLPTPPEFLLPSNVELVESKGHWNGPSTRLCLKLFGRLLKQENELMLRLPDIYVAASSTVKREMLLFINELMKDTLIHAETMSQLLDSCTAEADSLLTNVLRNYCHCSKLDKQLLDKVLTVYESQHLDVRFLSPVHCYMNKEKLESLIPRIVDLPNKAMLGQVVKLITCKSASSGRTLLSPVEFMVCLHKMHRDLASSKSQRVASVEAAIVQEREHFTRDVLVTSLQKVAELRPLPKLIFHTMDLTVSAHPKSLSFVQTLLRHMIKHGLWEQEESREDFLRFCKSQSVATLLHLSSDHLRVACRKYPDLHKRLMSHVESLPTNEARRISAECMAAIFGRRRDQAADVEDAATGENVADLKHQLRQSSESEDN